MPYYDAPVKSARPSKRAALATLLGAHDRPGHMNGNPAQAGGTQLSLLDVCHKAEYSLARLAGQGTSATQSAKQIPKALLQEAQGLFIFSALRTGLSVVSPAVGQGILVTRLPGDRWSCPATFGVQTRGGLGVGIDTVDCVLILRTRHVVKLFSAGKLVLDEIVKVRLGPVGMQATLPVTPDHAPVYGYVDRRGLFLGQVHPFKGIQLRHRQAEDEAFYRCRASCEDLVMGRVQSQAPGLAGLMQLVRTVTTRSGGSYTTTGHGLYGPPVAATVPQMPAPAHVYPQRPVHAVSSDPLFFRDTTATSPLPHVTRPVPAAAYPEYAGQMQQLAAMGYHDAVRNAELLGVYHGDISSVATVLRREGPALPTQDPRTVYPQGRVPVGGSSAAQARVSIWS